MRAARPIEQSRSLGAIFLFLVVALLGFAAPLPASATAYDLCAFREGSEGPCTCKRKGDEAGQFTTVNKRYCRRWSRNTAAAPQRVAGPAQAPAQTPVQAADEPSTMPTGTVAQAEDKTSASPAAASSATSKLNDVRARGKLLCGVNTGLLGFASQSDTGAWIGLDVDFCRAVAAAVFADASKVEFVPVEMSARFEALKSGSVDILARNTTWTMNREVEYGIAFAGVLYFDGQGLLVSAERGLVSAQQLTGMKVCVVSGTTSEKNLAYYFKALQINAETQTFASHAELLKAYQGGACDVYSADRSLLYAERAGFAEPLKHDILPEVISKEPLGPSVQQGDEEWSRIVRWTLSALINAEEVGLDRASATSTQPLSEDAQRLVDGAAAGGEKLRLQKSWLRDVVAAVGNYGEMFEANVGKGSPLGMERGINALWKRGGILYAPPMW